MFAKYQIDNETGEQLRQNRSLWDQRESVETLALFFTHFYKKYQTMVAFTSVHSIDLFRCYCNIIVHSIKMFKLYYCNILAHIQLKCSNYITVIY